MYFTTDESKMSMGETVFQHAVEAPFTVDMPKHTIASCISSLDFICDIYHF